MKEDISALANYQCVYISSWKEARLTYHHSLFGRLVFGELRSDATQCCVNFPSFQEVLDLLPEKPSVLLRRVIKSKDTHLTLGSCLPTGFKNYNSCLFLIHQPSCLFSVVFVI